MYFMIDLASIDLLGIKYSGILFVLVYCWLAYSTLTDKDNGILTKIVYLIFGTIPAGVIAIMIAILFNAAEPLFIDIYETNKVWVLIFAIICVVLLLLCEIVIINWLYEDFYSLAWERPIMFLIPALVNAIPISVIFLFCDQSIQGVLGFFICLFSAFATWWAGVFFLAWESARKDVAEVDGTYINPGLWTIPGYCSFGLGCYLIYIGIMAI